MKLTEEKGVFQTNIDESQSQSFGIGDESIVIEILRNRLYENKIQTLVQEYMSNARDAHREIGQTRPIEVTFPTSDSLTFEVRDFGPGITPERMSNVFVLYGASTKRGTNNQTGGFGIGAKSAWAYTDTFTVITYIDGIKRIYVADSLKNGRITLFSEENTEENNGTTISISVKWKDLRDFRAAIIRGSMYWSEPEYPSFKNSEGIEALGDAREVGLTRFMDTSISGVDAYRHTFISGPQIVIDGIPYPMPSGISNTRLSELQDSASQVTLFIPNGLVQVSASREKIDDSDISKKALDQIFTDALSQFKKALAKWEGEIKDGADLLKASSRSAGFSLSSSKELDFVRLVRGNLLLSHGRVSKVDIDSFPLNEGVSVSDEGETSIEISERLFSSCRVKRDTSSRSDFKLNSENKYYLIKSGQVLKSDIQNYIRMNKIDHIDLINVLAQSETYLPDGSAKFKRSPELAEELIEVVERLGFKNIEDIIPKSVRCNDGEVVIKRPVGNIYRIKEHSESLVTVSELKDKSGPWVYIVGRKSDHSYTRQSSLIRNLGAIGEIQCGFRVVDSKLKYVEKDPNFVNLDEFLKSWTPSKRNAISYLMDRYINNDEKTRVRQIAIANIIKSSIDKKHPLYRAASTLINSRLASNRSWEIQNAVTNSDSYKELQRELLELNKFIDKYIPLTESAHSYSHHIHEYVEWGLSKANSDGVSLNLPNLI